MISESEKVKVKVAQSCLTLCNTMDCNPPGSSVDRILQSRVLELVAISYYRASNLYLLCLQHWKVDSLSLSHQRGSYHRISVQSVSLVSLFVTPWAAAYQASLSITNSRTLHKFLSMESLMPSNHLILCHPLLLLPSIFPSNRVFSSESALHIRWPEYWSFSFSIHPSNEYSGLISLGWTGWSSLQSKGLSRVFSNTTVEKHEFFGTQPSSQSNSHIHT